jgi:hypothetical protein
LLAQRVRGRERLSQRRTTAAAERGDRARDDGATGTRIDFELSPRSSKRDHCEPRTCTPSAELDRVSDTFGDGKPAIAQHRRGAIDGHDPELSRGRAPFAITKLFAAQTTSGRRRRDSVDRFRNL